ncbi:MAG: hypothetical protein CM15mP93_17700 [Thiotrichaceae bacterium]|nr:MAG: hypothetical protein CM15mP93_17700 [Thiotrichaceae bacterium]
MLKLGPIQLDRGTLDNTIICNGVKIDNQVQVAQCYIGGKNGSWMCLELQAVRL